MYYAIDNRTYNSVSRHEKIVDNYMLRKQDRLNAVRSLKKESVIELIKTLASLHDQPSADSMSIITRYLRDFHACETFASNYHTDAFKTKIFNISPNCRMMLIYDMLISFGLNQFIDIMNEAGVSFDRLFFSIESINKNQDSYTLFYNTYSHPYYSLLMNHIKKEILRGVILENELERNARKGMHYDNNRLYQHSHLPWEIVLKICENFASRKIEDRNKWLLFFQAGCESLHATSQAELALNNTYNQSTAKRLSLKAFQFNLRNQMEKFIKYLSLPLYDDAIELEMRQDIREVVSNLVEEASK